MKWFMLAACLCSFSSPAFTQHHFVEGWLVTANGDTLKGYLQEEIKNNILHAIQFSPNQQDSNAQTFGCADLRSFQYQGGGLYLPVSFINQSLDKPAPESCFAQKILGGASELFEIENDEKTYFVLHYTDTTYFLFNTIYAMSGEVVKEGNYANTLLQLETACGQSLGADRVEYRDKEILAFIIKFNKCILPSSLSTSYFQKAKTKTEFSISAGILPVSAGLQSELEVRMRVYYPKLGKKTSIVLGVHYSYTSSPYAYRDDYYSLIHTTVYHQIFSVPLTIQYNFTNGPIQPFAYAGLGLAYINQSNLLNPQHIGFQQRYGITIVGGLGIEAHISSRLSAVAEWRYELILHYPTIGLSYRFN
jgi:hypothetical protein